MIPVPRPHLFAAVAHRAELRRVSAGALAAFMDHTCDDCTYGHPCAESRRLLAAFHAARDAEKAAE